MTDWHTDQLARDAIVRCGVGGTIFVNNVSRLVIDPERLTDGTEPMLAVGMGPVYQSTSQRTPLRRPDPDEDNALMSRWFHPYAAAFSEVVDEVLARHGQVTIVDLHSYPTEPLPYELDPHATRPAVCVGTDPVHTPDWLVAAVTRAFDDAAPNTPFAGTYVPSRHWGRNPDVRSVMIEIRRDLYIPDHTDVVARLAACLAELGTN